jgi:uncharacterized protein (UPF0332 family)
MRLKALRSLAAFDVLARAGGPCVEASMSRAYYAAFQAAVAALERQGHRPGSLSSDATRWQHAVVLNNASLVRGRRDDRELLRALFTLRVRADYSNESITIDLLSTNLLVKARAFVEDSLR